MPPTDRGSKDLDVPLGDTIVAPRCQLMCNIVEGQRGILQKSFICSASTQSKVQFLLICLSWVGLESCGMVCLPVVWLFARYLAD